jgi:hypothetical protein
LLLRRFKLLERLKFNLSGFGFIGGLGDYGRMAAFITSDSSAGILVGNAKFLFAVWAIKPDHFRL